MDVHDKLIHDGKKEMKCEFCDKTFRIAVSLKYHVRTGMFFKYFYICYLDSHCTTFSQNHRKEPAKGSIAFFIASCPLNQ